MTDSGANLFDLPCPSIAGTKPLIPIQPVAEPLRAAKGPLNGLPSSSAGARLHRWPLPLSLALHAGALAAVLLAGVWDAEPSPPVAAIELELVSPLPAEPVPAATALLEPRVEPLNEPPAEPVAELPPPEPPATTPPPAEPSPPADPIPPITEPPPAPVVEPPPPEPSPTPTPEPPAPQPMPEPARPKPPRQPQKRTAAKPAKPVDTVKRPAPPTAPPTAPSSATPAAAAPPSAAPAPQAAVPAAVDTPSGPPPDYLAAVQARLARYKIYPRAAQLAHEEGTVLLRFVIASDGAIVSWRIERSSGHDGLDHAVEAMIERASPLPPIPPEMRRDRLDIVLPVRYALR